MDPPHDKDGQAKSTHPPPLDPRIDEQLAALSPPVIINQQIASTVAVRRDQVEGEKEDNSTPRELEIQHMITTANTPPPSLENESVISSTTFESPIENNINITPLSDRNREENIPSPPVNMAEADDCSSANPSSKVRSSLADFLEGNPHLNVAIVAETWEAASPNPPDLDGETDVATYEELDEESITTRSLPPVANQIIGSKLEPQSTGDQKPPSSSELITELASTGGAELDTAKTSLATFPHNKVKSASAVRQDQDDNTTIPPTIIVKEVSAPIDLGNNGTTDLAPASIENTKLSVVDQTDGEHTAILEESSYQDSGNTSIAMDELNENTKSIHDPVSKENLRAGDTACTGQDESTAPSQVLIVELVATVPLPIDTKLAPHPQVEPQEITSLGFASLQDGENVIASPLIPIENSKIANAQLPEWDETNTSSTATITETNHATLPPLDEAHECEFSSQEPNSNRGSPSRSIPDERAEDDSPAKESNSHLDDSTTRSLPLMNDENTPCIPEMEGQLQKLAHLYCSHVWDVTMIKERITTSVTLAKNVEIAFEDRQRSGDPLTPEILAEYHTWMEWQSSLCDRWEKHLTKLLAETQIHRDKYANRSNFENETMREPVFVIDATECRMRLKIQKKFEVARQAILISSAVIPYDVFYRYTHSDKGRFYFDPEFLCVGEKSAKEEYNELQRLTAHEIADRTWLFPRLSRALHIHRNGMPVNRREWNIVQGLRRCIRVEDALGEPTPRGIDYQPIPDGGDGVHAGDGKSKQEQNGNSNRGWDYKRHAAEMYEKYQRNQSRNDQSGWENTHSKQDKEQNWGDHEEQGFSAPEQNWNQYNCTGGWDEYDPQQVEDKSENQNSEQIGEEVDVSKKQDDGSDTDEKEEEAESREHESDREQQSKEPIYEEWEEHIEQDDKADECHWSAIYGGGRTLGGNTPKAATDSRIATDLIDETGDDGKTTTQEDVEGEEAKRNAEEW